MTTKHILYDANYDFDNDEIENRCVAVTTDDQKPREKEPVIVQVLLGHIGTKALVDSGSVSTITHRTLANAVVMNVKNSYWLKPSIMHDLKTFWNDIIKIVGVIATTGKCNDWTPKALKSLY